MGNRYKDGAILRLAIKHMSDSFELPTDTANDIRAYLRKLVKCRQSYDAAVFRVCCG